VKIALISSLIYFFEDLLGFNPGVFPGVFLLSRLRLSGLPVESAIGFGPGLRAIIFILVIERKSLTFQYSFYQGFYFLYLINISFHENQ
jgi:hypothetical protein